MGFYILVYLTISNILIFKRYDEICADNTFMKTDSKINKLILSKKYTGIYTREVNDKGTKRTKVYVSINNSRRLLGYLGDITLAYASQYRQEEITRLRLGENPKLIRKKDIILFEELAQDWKNKQKAEQLIEATKNSQRYHNHVHKTFSKLNIKDIKPQDILEFKKEKLKTLKPATVFHLCGIIGGIFHNAIHRTGKMAGKTNPAYKIFTKKEFNNKRERWLKLEECWSLLSEIQKSDSGVKEAGEFYVRIILSTGIRSGSCLILQRKHFNIENRTLQAYDAKNREFYTTYLNDKLLSNDYLHKMLDNLNNEDYVLQYKDKPLLRKTLHRFTYPIYKKLFNFNLLDSDEKHKVCNHTLRHTFATHAVMHNDIFLVQKLLNHRDINQTLRYAKIQEDKKAEAVSVMYK